MNYDGATAEMAFLLGLLMIVVGTVVSIGATFISERFFYYNDRVKIALRFIGALLALFGAMLVYDGYPM